MKPEDLPIHKAENYRWRESIVWHQKWQDLRAKGIDGFKVGVPPGQRPGSLTFDIICNKCDEPVETGVSDLYFALRDLFKSGNRHYLCSKHLKEEKQESSPI